MKKRELKDGALLMVSIDKQSKKKQKKFHSMQRLSWGNVHPSTKIHKSINRRDERNKERGKVE